MSQQMSCVALVGHPNAGKSTLFNGLTGSEQYVGNWPGVTVEKKSGYCRDGKLSLELIDLPGCYSLVATEDLSKDEQITMAFLDQNQPDLILNVVDSTCLAQQLYLTYQLLARFNRVVVVLTMQDAARKAGLEIDTAALARTLGCPVFFLKTTSDQQVSRFAKQLLEHTWPMPCSSAQKPILSYAKPIEQWVKTQGAQSGCSRIDLLNALEGDYFACQRVNLDQAVFSDEKATLETQLGEDLDVYFAKMRFSAIQNVMKSVAFLDPNQTINTWTQKIDRFVLNRFLGVPIFLGMLYGLFVFAIQFSALVQTVVEDLSQPLLWQPFLDLFGNNQLIAGLILGLQTLLSFVPVLGAMFLGLGFLEASGAAVRAAFIVDRLMRFMGLPGQSLVPMIIGFGCNVPAVMGARALGQHKEQVLTVMMSPFMSCGARLCIYALFVTAFFPVGGYNIIFALYLIGVLVAFLTGWCLRKTLLPGKGSAWIMTLPAYRWPALKPLLKTTWRRLKSFISKAGVIIIPLCILLGPNTQSWLEKGAQHITPIFEPMGITADNWPATMGLFSGAVAKEAVVGTLNRLYSNDANTPAYGVMFEKFGSASAAFAYLLFILLYSPCVSVVAAIARELNKRWACFSVFWTSGTAYWVAVLFYQGANFFKNPMYSSAWILAGLLYFLVCFYGLKQWTLSQGFRPKQRLIPLKVQL